MSSAATQPGRILLVDDEPDLREVVSKRLRVAKHDVTEVASGAEALAKIRDERFEVVLLDVMMPEMNGLEVLARLQEMTDKPAVIILSARDEITMRVQSLDMGANDYLIKPFEAAELVARVNVAIRQTRALRDAISVAHEDSLTGLGNRRAFDQRLEQEVARALRHSRPVSLMLLDADGLKRVNDAHGHAVGDEMLRTIAECLQQTVRISDHAARIGGDEFAVILPETSSESMAFVERRINASFGRARYHKDLVPAASMGVASLPTDAVDASNLKRIADERLYDAKIDRGSMRPVEESS